MFWKPKQLRCVECEKLGCKMPENFCVKWGDFQDSVISTFVSLRKTCEFSDVTLACEDGQQVEAHKVILAASSPFFQKLLQRDRHPHPLVYMKGVNAGELAGIVDFLYYGEANVEEDSLDAFLKLADELQLKGLTDISESRSKSRNTDIAKHEIKPEEKHPNVDEEGINASQKNPGLPIQNNLVNLEELNTVIKEMMEKSDKLILAGKVSCYISLFFLILNVFYLFIICLLFVYYRKAMEEREEEVCKSFCVQGLWKGRAGSEHKEPHRKVPH